MNPSVDYKLLRQYFLIASDYFDLTPATHIAAWQSAMRSPVKAFKCYRAIVKSL